MKECELKSWSCVVKISLQHQNNKRGSDKLSLSRAARAGATRAEATQAKTTWAGATHAGPE